MKANQSVKPPRITLSAPEILATYRTARAIDVALAAVGLTFLQAALLASFAEPPDATAIGVVAKALGVSPSVATGGVDLLEAAGYVRRLARARSESDQDRRTVRVAVTDQGRAVLAALSELEVER
jgi:DNA-binding MarR family transcriptional regulator